MSRPASPWISRPLELRAGAGGERLVRGRIERFGPPAGDALREARGRPFALLSHGYRSWMSWGFLPVLARRLAAEGFVVLRFDYSGNGIGADLVRFEEEEAFRHDTYSRELEDLEAVRAAALARPDVDPARGVLFGHSRGAGVALIHAVERGDYRALCAWAGIVQVASWTPEKKVRWREQGALRVPATGSGRPVHLATDVIDDAERHRERFDLEALAARLRTRTLFVHGERDAGVPPDEIERLASLAPPGVARVARIPGAGHGLGARHPAAETAPPLERAIAETTAFLREAAAAGRPG